MSELFTYRTAEEVAAESTHNDNPFGLVYSGAITENVPGKVNIIPISYMPDGLRLVANVYVPAGYDKGAEKKYAGVVVAHPNGGVKEQVAGLYAQRLAENGYVALAFDAAYQGHSEGQPRNTDKPAHRVEDIHRACDIIRVFPGVDPERVGVLGICGGGGYTIKAAQDRQALQGRGHAEHVQHRRRAPQRLPRQRHGDHTAAPCRGLRGARAGAERQGSALHRQYVRDARV